MDEHNPFQPPASRIDPAVAGDAALAGRWERLGAVLLDGLIQFVVLLPIMFVGGYFEMVMEAGRTGVQPPYATGVIWALVGFVVFVLLQGWPLHQNGQTWGKRIVGIRIVDMAGAKPPFNRLIAMRYLPLQLLNLIPLLGPLIALVDVLFIFREDRRCLHDLVAGTRVVSAR